LSSIISPLLQHETIINGESFPTMGENRLSI